MKDKDNKSVRKIQNMLYAILIVIVWGSLSTLVIETIINQAHNNGIIVMLGMIAILLWYIIYILIFTFIQVCIWRENE